MARTKAGSPVTKSPVSVRAVEQRINRKLAEKRQRLMRSRSERARAEVGDHYVVDVDRNLLVLHHVNLEALARKLGVLAEWEAIADNKIDVTDVVAVRAKLIETLRLVATPIDFDGLIRDGILAKSRGRWYEILDLRRLPENAACQATELLQEKRGGRMRTFYRFGESNAKAAALYEQITGEKFTPD